MQYHTIWRRVAYPNADDDDEDHVLAQLVTVGHPGTQARVSGSSASDTGAAASSNGLSQASLVAGEGAGIGDEWKHLQDVREERHLTPGGASAPTGGNH